MIRQYIGARYTPKFMGLYDPTVQYENLCVVDNGVGTSYISTKIVPPNTPLINREYWQIYGASSGAILDLQERMGSAEEDITAINGEISNISSSILRMGGEIDNIEDVIIPEISEKLAILTENYTTPEAYGAIGDGLTDDSEAIQTAVNSSKYVYFSKRYKITTGINVPEGVTLFGYGTIIPSTYMNVFTLSDNDVVDGLNFTDGLPYENEWAHIYGFEVDNVIVKNCKFESLGIGYAILFDHSTHIKVERNTIKNYAFSGIMFLHTCSYFDVLYNYVYNSSGRLLADHNYPIGLSGYTDHQYGPAHHIRCNYNYIEELSPFWEGIDSHGCNDYEIIGNTIKNVYIGIAMGYKRTGDTGFTLANCNGVIRDNIISFGIPINEPTLEYSKGIYIASGDTTYTYNLEISNNTISGTQLSNDPDDGTSAIAVSLGDGSADNINIINNYFNCTNTTCIGFGARGAANNIRIIGNFFHNIVGNNGVKYGIYLAQTRLYTNITVADNACQPGLTNDNTKRRFIRGVASQYPPRNHKLCEYINNSDCGLDKDSMDWFTSARSAISTATKAEGVAGQFIPSTGTGIAGWVCQSIGHWIAIAGTSA